MSVTGRLQPLENVGDILVHDKNTPSDSPLLGANETTTLRGRRNFRNIDRDLSRLDTDTETVDDTSGNEHAHILRSTDNDGTDDPIEAGC